MTYITFDRTKPHPDLAKLRSGYDCMTMSRSFARSVAMDMSEGIHLMFGVNVNTIPKLVEFSIRNVLRTYLAQPSTSYSPTFFSDLANITGVSVLCVNENELDSYVTLLRNIFIRAIELGLVVISDVKINKLYDKVTWLRQFEVSLVKWHPRLHRSYGNQMVIRAEEWRTYNPGHQLPPSFFNDDELLRTISPYIPNFMFTAKFNGAFADDHRTCRKNNEASRPRNAS